jgi:hypothetical protein
MTRRKIDYWVIPPESDGEFVASMEEVLETYAQPYDAKHPVICMDEQPIQLLKETRVPIPATRKHPRRVDYEYERAGTASIFMFCEPLSNWRCLLQQPNRFPDVCRATRQLETTIESGATVGARSKQRPWMRAEMWVSPPAPQTVVKHGGRYIQAVADYPNGVLLASLDSKTRKLVVKPFA